MVFDRNILIKR